MKIRAAVAMPLNSVKSVGQPLSPGFSRAHKVLLAVLLLTVPFAAPAPSGEAEGARAEGSAELRSGQAPVSRRGAHRTLRIGERENLQTAGDPAALLVLLPGETETPGLAPGKTGEPVPVIVGQATAVDIWVVDADWNPIRDFAGTVELAVTDPLADLPATAELLDGTVRVTVSWMTVGLQTVTANSASGLTGSATLQVFDLFVPGLWGQYFSNTQLEPPAALGRVDKVVDFDWAFGSPAPEIPEEYFSARWTGRIQAETSEPYTFYTLSDDGVRLWVDEQLLIDNWTVHGSTWDSGSIDLVAGQQYSLRMEYFEAAGEAVARLLWESPSIPQQVIPSARLSHADLSNSTIEVTPASLVANLLEAATVSVDLQSAAGLPIADAEVYLNVSGSHNWINGEAVGDDAWVSIGLSDATGQVAASLSSSVAEPKIVRARVEGMHLDRAGAVEFLPDQPSQLLILLPGERLTPGDDPGKAGEVKAIIVDHPSFFDVMVVDANWNLVDSYADDLDIVSTDPAALLPSSASLAFGQIRIGVTWRTLGAQTLTVTSDFDPALSAEVSLQVVPPPQLVVGDGEVVTVDDVRYPMTGFAEEGQSGLHYDGTPGFDTGDEILIIVMQGDAIGTAETAVVEEVMGDRLELTDDLHNSYDGIADRVMVQRVPVYGQVTVRAGGRITAHGWDGETGGVAFLRADALTVEAGGTIDVSGLGFRPGEGPGSGGHRSGGGHGGYGGDDPGKAGTGGVGYGSAVAPSALGSGGGDAHPGGGVGQEAGGPGGGVLWLEVAGTLRLDGELRANGVPRMVTGSLTPGGGGAGGSLRVKTGDLMGSGVISANGGASFWTNFELTSYFGGGSGGRIAVSSETNAFTGTWRAFGGQAGSSPGTLFLEDRTLARTTLRVDFGLAGGRPAILTDRAVTHWEFDRLELTRNADLELLDPEDTIELALTNMAGDGTGQVQLHYAFEYAEPELRGLGLYIHPDGELLLPAAFTVRGAELSLYGNLIGLQDLSMAADGGVSPVVRLAATGQSDGQPVGTFEIGTMVVPSGARLELASDVASARGLRLLVSTLTIHAGGQVVGDGLGYQVDGDRGPGGTTSASGAGHGGFGGGSAGGAPYGAALEPTTLGSAGSGAGGGAIHLVADSLHVDGVLSSDGLAAARGGGGGAGGSLWLEIGTLSGAGIIRADGGHRNIFQSISASGAGGRISLAYTTNTYSGSLSAAGGPNANFGGPGTIVLSDIGSGSRALLVDNKGRSGRQAGLSDPAATTWVFDAITLVGNGHLALLDSDDTIALTESTVFGDGTATLSSFGTISVPDAYTIADYTLDVRGALSGGVELHVANRGGLGLHAQTALHEVGPYSFDRLSVAGGATVTLTPHDNGDGDYSNDSPFELMVGELSIAADGTISTDGRGYPSQRGPGAGAASSTDTGASGAGYGGTGGAGQGQPLGGATYGSSLNPADLGSGGGNRSVDSTCGGAGGGAIHVIVSGALVIDGTIRANGLAGKSGDRGCGGGSGGSVWIEADLLQGVGSIIADGGAGSGGTRRGGGGGGGRIALYAGGGDFAGSLQAHGGPGFEPGADGTVFFGNVDPILSTVTIEPSLLPTDGLSQATVRVTLKNRLDLPIPDAPVEVALASGGDAYLNGQLVTIDQYVAFGETGADGVASGTIRAEKIGVRTIRARSGLEPIAQLGEVEFVAGPIDASSSFVNSGAFYGLADGVSPVSIIVTARDQFGNPIAGLPVEIFATGNAVVSQPTQPTNNLGHATGSVTDATAESVTVTARIDGVLVDDQATVTFIGADLAVDKSALAQSNYDGLSSTHALAGGTISYTIDVSNTGSLAAADVQVTDLLPAGLTFASEDNGYPFLVDGQLLTWQLGSVPVSGSVTLEFEASIAADVLGIVTNSVAATTSATEGDLADNSAELNTTVEQPRASMVVSPAGPTMTVLKGGISVLDASVRNTGAALMTGVAAAPPPTIPWVSVDPSAIGDIAPLEQAGFTILAAPPAALASGYYRDFVTVGDDIGNARKIALVVRVSEPRRDLQATIENDQGDLVQGAALSLVRQQESVVVTEGAVETYHESARTLTPASGTASIAGLEVGVYDYTVTASDHQPASGVLTIVEGEGAQQVRLSLSALGRIGLSPGAPVLGVLRGQTNSTTITLTNLGAGPLTGLSVAPPASMPFVTLGLPDPLPVLLPGESLQFSILASPAADQTGDIFQDYITASADDGLSGRVALTVQLTSDAVRDAEVAVVNAQGQGATGGGTVTLIQQKLTTLVVGGETRTFNRQFTGQLDPVGRASFPGLEPGAYNFLASANGYAKEAGEIVIQPGTGVQVETIAAKIDPFTYTWSVVPVEQDYDITLTMTFDVTTPDPVLTVPEVCWPLNGGPMAETIKVFNPSAIPLVIDSVSASLPGASIQIESFPSLIGARQLMNIPVTATKVGALGTGSVQVAYSWDAAPDRFVTFTLNPSSLTSPIIPPGFFYAKDYLVEPAVFDPDTTYTLELGQPSELTWISLVADQPDPMQWTSQTVITLSMTATPPTYLPTGVYSDSAQITITGDDDTIRHGTLEFTATKTDQGVYLHSSFVLGEIPSETRQAAATGTIASGACSRWIWTAVGGAQPKLIGQTSGPSASFPSQGGGPVYDFGHQQVRLELSQKVMLEGEGFKANLDIVNTSAAPIEDISIDIRLTTEAGLDMSYGFTTIPETPTSLGTVTVGGSASGEWFILPSGLGITSPEGEVYLASAILRYRFGGTDYQVATVPERITVYPAPDLVITYQLPLPRFPCTVFPLKVTIQNRGAGPARNLRFSTAQPKLQDPLTGLPITFTITSTVVNGEPKGNALNLALGDIPPEGTAVIVWRLESSRPGRFIEFTSDYRQSNFLNVPLSPLISEIRTFLVPGACGGVPDEAVLCPSGECPGIALQGTQGLVAGPINTRTGGVSFNVADFSFPTPAGPLSFERWYASRATSLYTQTLGFGWTHSLDSRLYFPDDPTGKEGSVLLKLHSANRFEFVETAPGVYTAYPGVCGTLVRHEGPPVSYTFTDDAQRVYLFDQDGRLMALADPQGNALHYAYDPDGRLQRVEDDSGTRYLLFTYGADSRLERVADHAGREVSYAYDPASGDLISATDVLGQVWTYAYDSEHRMLQAVDPRGVIVERSEYDAQGRAVRQFNGAGELVVELTYNADGTTIVRDALGNQQTHRYDERGALADQVDARGNASGKTYDPNFRPSTFTNPAGNVTQLMWSEGGSNLTQVTDAAGEITRLFYDGLNNLTMVIDAEGNSTSFVYQADLLASSTDALGNVTTYTYTDLGDAPAPPGLLETITDALGRTTSFRYDAFGQLTSITDAIGSATTFAYDGMGRLIETVDPLGRVSRNEYDAVGRLTRSIRNYNADRANNEAAQWNVTTEYLYDAAGNLIEVIDTLGRSTRYEYDDANRVTAVIDPADHRTTMSYDQAGNLVERRDPLGRVTRFEYDELARVVKVIDALGGETITSYDANGNVASYTDATSSTTTYTYDVLNRQIEVVDALGGRWTTAYDALGNVVATTDAAGRTTTFTYDALNRLIRQTDPEGGVTQIFYDAAGNRIRTVDPNGGGTSFEYDRLNRPIRAIDALGGMAEYEYDALGNQLAVTDANGNTRQYSYDLLNRPVEALDPLGNISLTSYDALGNVLATLDALGNQTSYAYDLLNRLVEQTDPLGGRTSYTYDAVGNQLTVTDANGHVTTAVYDSLNRPVETHEPNARVSRTSYDGVGNILAVTDGLNAQRTYVHDAMHRLVGMTDPLGNQTQFEYDRVGNRVGMTDAEGVVTRFEFDGMNRLTAVVENYRPGLASSDETNVRTEYSYDANGNRLAIRDANGHTTSFAYDSLNRMIEDRDALGNSSSYGYDPVGNRIRLTDALGFATTYTYDSLNRLIGIDYPGSDPDVRFTYNAVGDRTQMMDGVGTTTWAYDALHRPLTVTDPFGGTVGYAHDGVGNRIRLTYPDGKSVGYAYDASDRLVQVTDWDSRVASYSYDLANRLIETVLPNGVSSSYRYDQAGRLLEIQHRAATELLSSFSYSYDKVGNRTQAVEVISWPGQPQSVADYGRPIAMAQSPLGPRHTSAPVDPLTAGLAPFGLLILVPLTRRRQLRHPYLVVVLVVVAGAGLAACSFPIPTPTPVPTNTPTPTAIFTPTASPIPTATLTPIPTDTPTPTPEPIVVTTTTIDYSYDPLYRLTAADYSSGEYFHYTYDAVGNRLTQETHLASSSYTYDDANRLTSVDGVPYTWDANGNLLSDGVRSYTYDHANRLMSVTAGPDSFAFAYNGLGDRLRQTANGVPTEYTLDIEGGLTQVLSDGTATFLYGAGRIAQHGPNGLDYFLGDALGSVRQLVDADGTPELARSYEPFGDLLSLAGRLQTTYGFAGEWSDSTGLIHLRARYYEPTTGRFVQRDPFSGIPSKPASYNAYAYALDNPLIYTDPSGMFVETLLAIVAGAALGGIIGFIGGGAFARITYNWAYQGECGCEMQQWATGIDGNQWVRDTALLAGVIGAIAGGLAAAAPIGAIVVGIVGAGVAAYDLHQLVSEISARWQATAQLHFTKCELLRFVVDVVGIVGGALLARAGIRGAQQSGSVWRWQSTHPAPPVNSKGTPYPEVDVPGYGRVEFPEGPYSPNNSATRSSEFTPAFKNAFRRWWTDQGRPWPEGRVEIHHIKPLQFGGENVFENLVPLSPQVHRLFTSWWSGFKP